MLHTQYLGKTQSLIIEEIKEFHKTRWQVMDYFLCIQFAQATIYVHFYIRISMVA